MATDYEELLGSLLEGDEGEDDEGEGGEGAQLADQGEWRAAGIAGSCLLHAGALPSAWLCR